MNSVKNVDKKKTQVDDEADEQEKEDEEADENSIYIVLINIRRKCGKERWNYIPRFSS